jgi:integrase
MASLRRKPNSPFWFACFTLPDGTRTQRSTKTTDRRVAIKLAIQFEEASKTHLTESQARRVIADINKAQSGRRLESHSAEDYLTRWASLRKGTVAATTLQEYESAANEFIASLGDRANKDLAFITTTDVAHFRDKLSVRVSPSSVNKKLKIIRVAFQQAWRDGLIEENPAAKVKTLRQPDGQRERRAFTVDELRKLLAVAQGEWRGLILAGLYTGQRLGDVASLEWESINLKTATLSLTTQKTSRRQILPIPAPLLNWLKETEPQRASENKDVFPTAHARVKGSLRVGALSNQFQKIMADAGLALKRPHTKAKTGRTGPREVSELSFHSLRHTLTSLMKSAGVSPAIVQEFVGHDSKAVSQNYTHIDTETLRRAANVLPNLNGQAEAPQKPPE